VVIAVNPQAPFQTLAQLISLAKDKPNQFAFASPGNGSTPHMAVEFFERAAGISLQHIPYKGGSQAITDVIGGQLPLVAVNALEALPHVRSGKLKLLAVLSPNRSPNFPDVPTIAESGFAGFEASVWYGLVAPAATPRDVVNLLNKAFVDALQTPETKTRFAQLLAEPVGNTPEQFGAFMKKELARYENVVKTSGARVD
jgi:tripartite-type tricarboxylate transporter receptor subunit TctC